MPLILGRYEILCTRIWWWRALNISVCLCWVLFLSTIGSLWWWILSTTSFLLLPLPKWPISLFIYNDFNYLLYYLPTCLPTCMAAHLLACQTTYICHYNPSSNYLFYSKYCLPGDSANDYDLEVKLEETHERYQSYFIFIFLPLRFPSLLLSFFRSFFLLISITIPRPALTRTLSLTLSHTHTLTHTFSLTPFSLLF